MKQQSKYNNMDTIVITLKGYVRPTRCNKLRFVKYSLAQHVSGIIMPIFKSARPQTVE